MIKKIEEILFPTIYGNFNNSVYSIESEMEPYTSFAFAIYNEKTLTQEVPMVRIHSSCVFSEVFGSLVCDCSSQLSRTLKLFAKKGGVFLYMDQEGRSHGIFNKTKELKLQESKGLNTIEASEALGLTVDSRIYDSAVQILKDLSITRIKLVTNNPKKVTDLSSLGIDVLERIPMEIKCNGANDKYLKVKKEQMGHYLTMI